VKWSDGEVADVPPGVVTVTSTVDDPAGEVALICVDELTVNVLAEVVPNLTAVAPVRLVPVMVTPVAPVAGPVLGETFVTVGAAAYVKWSAADVPEVPLEVVTVTSTVEVPAGEVAVTWVDELTVNVLAALVPNVTAVAPVRFVPVIVTLVPPAVGPLEGETLVTVGAPGVPPTVTVTVLESGPWPDPL
jgi:hypothetical protein